MRVIKDFCQKLFSTIIPEPFIKFNYFIYQFIDKYVISKWDKMNETKKNNIKESLYYFYKYARWAFVPLFILAVFYSASLNEIIIALTVCYLIGYLVLLNDMNKRYDNASAFVEMLSNKSKAHSDIDEI